MQPIPRDTDIQPKALPTGAQGSSGASRSDMGGLAEGEIELWKSMKGHRLPDVLDELLTSSSLLEVHAMSSPRASAATISGAVRSLTNAIGALAALVVRDEAAEQDDGTASDEVSTGQRDAILARTC